LRLPELLAIRLVLSRALVLNEGWEGGAIHEAMIGLDGMSPLLGGSAARARQHFDRAVALAEGKSVFAYVTLAESVSVAAGDRAEFDKLLKAALAVDLEARPSIRLANLIAQRRARFLLNKANTLFPARR
jgi:predicted anti-sigma-YlaC factor YlaD